MPYSQWRLILLLSMHLKQEYDPHKQKWKFQLQPTRYDNSNTFSSVTVQSFHSRDYALTSLSRFTFSMQSICRLQAHCIRLLRCCIVFYIYFLFVAKSFFFSSPPSSIQSKNVESTKSSRDDDDDDEKEEKRKKKSRDRLEGVSESRDKVRAKFCVCAKNHRNSASIFTIQLGLSFVY